MQISDVHHLANLARLDIPQEEQEALLQDLTSILGYIDQINGAQIELGDPSAPEHRNIAREDIATNVTGSNTDALLAEAPATEGGFVKVKKVL